MSTKPTKRHQFPIKGGAYTDVTELIRLRHAAREIDSVTIDKSSNPLSGLLTSKFRGRGIDFAEVRRYEPGDDVRTIDWRVTARTQVAHTKLFQEEKERPVLVLVDQSHSLFFGSVFSFKSVLAAQAAALIAWVSLENGDRVGGIVFAESGHREIRPRRSKHAVLRLLNEINDFNHRLNKDHEKLDQETDYLSEALLNVRRVAKHGSTIFLISDYDHFSKDAQLHLRQLSRHNDIIGVHVSDPMEHNLPNPDLYTITNGAQRVQIDTADKRNRSDYEQQYESRLQQTRTEFSKLKSPLFELSTGDNVIQSLVDSYHSIRRAKR